MGSGTGHKLPTKQSVHEALNGVLKPYRGGLVNEWMADTLRELESAGPIMPWTAYRQEQDAPQTRWTILFVAVSKRKGFGSAGGCDDDSKRGSDTARVG